MNLAFQTRRDDAVAEAKKQLKRVDKAAGRTVALLVLQKCAEEEEKELQEGFRQYLKELELSENA